MPVSGPSSVDHYAELAQRAATAALGHMAEGDGDDAAAALSLAVVAWNVVTSYASEAERADMDEYELTDDGGYGLIDRRVCICPPDLLASGGFKGGCPVHSANAR